MQRSVERLPAAGRMALVLCYLEGRTQDEAAVQIGISTRTLRRHLERGRELLGRRLTKRGVTLGATLAACLVSNSVESAIVPRLLLVRTVAFASHTAAKLAAPASVLSARVAAITEGVLRTMNYGKYKTIVCMLACGMSLAFGVHQFAPTQVAAQDKIADSGPRAVATAPDIEPIDPNLVFNPDVQNKLHLSANQVHQLVAARDLGTAATADHGKRIDDIDQHMKKLQEELDRLQQDRQKACAIIGKAQNDTVKAAIPNVLSRDAVQQLRQMTLQSMRLSDILLDAKMRAQLDLNDEQVKKIQEIAEKSGGIDFMYTLLSRPSRLTTSQGLLGSFDTLSRVTLGEAVIDVSRSDLLKVLTPRQRAALERLSGASLEKTK